MEAAELRSKEYIPILSGKTASYGGSQMWMSGALRSGGCGAVAAADLALYLARSGRCPTLALSGGLADTPVPRGDYERFLLSFSHAYARPLPKLGMTGLRLAVCLNLFFKRYETGVRARWRQLCTLKDPLAELRRMLLDDLPAIISLPPAFGRKGGLAMRDLLSGRVRRYKGRGGHFVTVTGITRGGDGREKLVVSSWGVRYEIDALDYLREAKTPRGLLVCGMVLLMC